MSPFTFNRRQQRFLLLLLTAVVVCVITLREKNETIPLLQELQNEVLKEKTLNTYVQTAPRAEHKTVKKTSHKRRKKAICLQPFDPNSTDSTTLQNMGLPRGLAKSIVETRLRKGDYKRPEDLKHLKGMTKAWYARLQPHLKIDRHAVNQSLPPLTLHTTVLKHPAVPLPGSNEQIELNTADSLLMRETFQLSAADVKRIFRYRKRLGGFYSIAQLNEIKLKNKAFMPHVYVDASLVQRLHLNHYGVSRLAKHPYLTKTQAHRIVEHRKSVGLLTDINQLAAYPEFTRNDLQRLAPYVALY